MEIREIHKKQTFRGQKTYFKPFSTTLIGMVMVLLVLFSCSLVSAWDWDNVKDFEKGELEYGKITIYNALGLPLIGSKLAEYTLEDNTDQCLINCYAEGTAKLYSEGQLFSDLNFYNRKRNLRSLKDSKILIEVTESYEVDIPEYYKVCEEVYDEVNGTTYQDCHQEVLGSHKEIRYKTFWEEYGREVLKVGDYRWRIEAMKNMDEDIDWIGSAFGESFTEWAWWSAAYDYRYPIINNQTTAYAISVNDTNGVNGSIIWSLIGNNSYVYSTISNPSGAIAIANETVEKYWENESTRTGNSPTSVWGSTAKGIWHFGEGTGTAINDSSENGNDGTASGSPTWNSSGRFGYGMNFDGSDDYVDIPYDTSLNMTNQITIAMWINIPFLPSEMSLNYMRLIRTSNDAIDIYYEIGGKVTFKLTTTEGSTPRPSILEGNLSTGTWMYLVTTYDHDKARMYLNGDFKVEANRDNTDLIHSGDWEIGDKSDTYNLNGTIDEVRIYNVSLSADEILQQYNNGINNLTRLGTEEVRAAAPTIILNTPITNAKLNNVLVTFNGTVYDSGGVVNVSLILEGVHNETNSSGVNNSNYIFTKTISEGEHNWTYEACDNESPALCANTTVRTFEIDITYPAVNATSPTGNQGWFVTGMSLDLNWTASDKNLDSCWYQYNGTNITLTCGDNHTTFNVTNKSETNLFFYVNDTFGWLNTTNVSWYYAVLLENETYNNETWETKSETFQANVTIGTGYTIYSVHLVYNNTKYTVSDIQTFNETYQLTRTIDVPLNEERFANQTNSFFWRFTLVDSEENQEIQELPEDNQTVAFINLQLCNTTYNISTIKFTYKDEFTKTQINASTNATDIGTTFFYWLGSGGVQKNYSYENLSNSATSIYRFCFHPSDYTFRTDMDMEYEAEDYSPRTYYLRNATLTNQTNTIDLMLLLIDYSVKFFVTVKQGEELFTDAIVSISKYFTEEGLFRGIGIRKTDDRGRFIEYFDIDKNFQFSFVKDGVSYGTIERWVTCKEAPCELELQIEEIIADLWQGYYDVFAQNVAYTLRYNDTTGMVTFTFTDLTGLAQWFRLVVEQSKYNVSAVTICDETLYTTFGTLTCNVSTKEGDFTAYTYVNRSPSKLIDYIKFVRQTMKDIFGATGILIAFFIIITIALVGAWNPAVGVALTALAIFACATMGFIALGQFAIISIIVLAVIIIIKMKV